MDWRLATFDNNYKYQKLGKSVKDEFYFASFNCFSQLRIKSNKTVVIFIFTAGNFRHEYHPRHIFLSDKATREILLFFVIKPRTVAYLDHIKYHI